MSKVFIKPYQDYELTGKDFAAVKNSDMRRILMSPDNRNSISLIELRDGCLCITNNNKIPFGFSVSRGQKVLAVVACCGHESMVKINSNWRLSKKGIENREIHTNPDLIMSQTLNIDIGGTIGFGRIDLKVDDSGYAACIFSKKDLLFMKMNGNHTFPRLEGFVEGEVERLLEDPAREERVGRKFFQKWALETGFGRESFNH